MNWKWGYDHNPDVRITGPSCEETDTVTEGWRATVAATIQVMNVFHTSANHTKCSMALSTVRRTIIWALRVTVEDQL